MRMLINIPDSNHDAVDTALNRLADLYPQKYAELLQDERFQGLANFIVECHPVPVVKIQNMKLFRELSGLGLADSKRMIEAAYTANALKKAERFATAVSNTLDEDDDLPF
jgi:ribosomal protein L7/L12